MARSLSFLTQDRLRPRSPGLRGTARPMAPCVYSLTMVPLHPALLVFVARPGLWLSVYSLTMGRLRPRSSGLRGTARPIALIYFLKQAALCNLAVVLALVLL